MKEVSDLRRSLAEVTSAREAAEAERKRQVEEEVERIHQVFQKDHISLAYSVTSISNPKMREIGLKKARKARETILAKTVYFFIAFSCVSGLL